MIAAETLSVNDSTVYPIATVEELLSSLAFEFGFTVVNCHRPWSIGKSDPGESPLHSTWKAQSVFLNLIDSDNPAHWLARAHLAAQCDNSLVVALVPRRFQADWWRLYSQKVSELRLPEGRLVHGLDQIGCALEIALFIFRPRS